MNYNINAALQELVEERRSRAMRPDEFTARQYYEACAADNQVVTYHQARAELSRLVESGRVSVRKALAYGRSVNAYCVEVTQ